MVPQGLGVDQRALWNAQNAYSGANYAAGMKRIIDQVGREPEGDELEPMTWASLKGGRRYSGAEALWDMQELRMLARGVLTLFETFDVFLCPTLHAPPPKTRLPQPGERAARRRPPAR